jgi:hypothetical protein
VMEVPTVCSRPMNGADRETRRGPAAAWHVGGLSPLENACFLFSFSS